MGNGASAGGVNAVTVGTTPRLQTWDAIALGTNASAQQAGNNAQATHNNGVALDNGSLTTAANTVSVGGGTASNRCITNVADPVKYPRRGDQSLYVDSLVG